MWKKLWKRLKRAWVFVRKQLHNIKQLLIILLILILTFSVILILPAISKILINFKIFSSMEELSSYISMYNNKYSIIFIIIGLAVMTFIFGDREKIIDVLGKFNYIVKRGDTSVSAVSRESDMDEESIKRLTEVLLDKSKESIKEEDNENSKESMQEIKSILDIDNNQKNKNKNMQKNVTLDENKKVIETLREENDTLRFYATYNIINKKTKELLTQIYYERYIESYKFKELIIKNYKKNNKNNKNISKNNLEKYANDKYETIFKALNYLKIIDLSEDNKEIRLTDKGKKFVDEYIIKERWFG